MKWTNQGCKGFTTQSTFQPSCALGNDKGKGNDNTSGQSQLPHGEAGLSFRDEVQSSDIWRELRRSCYAAEFSTKQTTQKSTKLQFWR